MPTPIILEKTIFTDNYVLVASPSTAWVNEYANPCRVEDVLALFDTIISHVRSCGIKTIGSRAYKASLLACQAEAAQQSAQYQTLFESLKAGWEQKVVKGLTSPVVDDPEVNALNHLSSQRHALLYGEGGRTRTSLRFFMAQQAHLSELWNNLKNSAETDRIQSLRF